MTGMRLREVQEKAFGRQNYAQWEQYPWIPAFSYPIPKSLKRLCQNFSLRFAVLGGLKGGVCNHAGNEMEKGEPKGCGVGGQAWTNKKGELESQSQITSMNVEFTW